MRLPARRFWVMLGLAALGIVAASCHRLLILDSPTLVEEDLIFTRPFVGSSTKMFDAEAMTDVPADGTVWMADDNGNRLYEMDAATGALLSTVDAAALELVPEFGGGPAAGPTRVGDLEAVAYDPVDDLLYAISNSICAGGCDPTIFRLTRSGSTFAPESWQDLSADHPAAAVTPSGEIIVSTGPLLHSYDYETNALGAGFPITDLRGTMSGLSFSDDGFDLWVGTGVRVYRVDWRTTTVVDGYGFDSSDHGLGDSRALEIMDDRIWVQDGDDTLDPTDPLKYAIHIYRIDGLPSSPLDPVPAIEATTSPVGLAPFSVDLDASASFDPDGTIEVYHWFVQFSDEQDSTLEPTHTEEFTEPGVYNATVTVEDDGANLALAYMRVVAKEPNVAPVLDPVGSFGPAELQELTFTATASDTNVPVDNLTFSLDGAPPGASITAGGDFSWTPSEAQGPTVHTFDVVVTDDGFPAMEDRETIRVEVGEVNEAPVLDPVGNRTVAESSELAFTATAGDVDLPANRLVFSLDGAVPAGASITAGGDFSWTPDPGQGPGVFAFDVVVTDDGIPALEDRETITVTVVEGDILSIAAGKRHSCAVLVDETTWCWGDNGDGQLGDGTNDHRSAPVQVTGGGGVGFLTDIAAVSAGEKHTCALTATGDVWCWGKNDKGQLGDGTGDDSDTPVQVAGPSGTGALTDVVAIAVGANHSCAGRTDGTVWCWGLNDKGQLGDGTGDDSDVPVPVGRSGGGVLPDVSTVGAGKKSTCAVTTGGSVFCWGENNEGQLGDGTTDNRTAPVQVVGPGGLGTLTGAAGVGGGEKHTCANRADGSVLCWGKNDRGQLGDGTTDNRTSPVPVAGVGGVGALSDVVTVGLGKKSSCAVTTAGSVLCWGANGRGQLGDGSTDPSGTPVAVAGDGGGGLLTGALGVAGGEAHTCAGRDLERVACWGGNDRGQLGDGSTEPSDTPVSVLL